jgi:signal transduction histidine kinase
MATYDPAILEQVFEAGDRDMLVWLSYIEGCARVLHQHPDHLNQDDQQHLLTGIKTTAQRCRHILTTKMAAFTLLTTDLFHEPSEPLDLPLLIQEVIETRHINATSSGQTITIDVHSDPGLPRIRANRRGMEYFLQTLLGTLAQNTAHIHGQVELRKDHENIRITLRPLDILTPEYGYLLTLLITAQGGIDAAIETGVLQFTFGGNPE